VGAGQGRALGQRPELGGPAGEAHRLAADRLDDAADGSVARGQGGGERQILTEMPGTTRGAGRGRDLPAPPLQDLAAGVRAGGGLGRQQGGALHQLAGQRAALTVVETVALAELGSQAEALGAVGPPRGLPNALAQPAGLAGEDELRIQADAGSPRRQAGGGGVDADAAPGPDRQPAVPEESLEQHEAGLFADPSPGFVTLGHQAVGADSAGDVGLRGRDHLDQQVRAARPGLRGERLERRRVAAVEEHPPKRGGQSADEVEGRPAIPGADADAPVSPAGAGQLLDLPRSPRPVVAEGQIEDADLPRAARGDRDRGAVEAGWVRGDDPEAGARPGVRRLRAALAAHGIHDQTSTRNQRISGRESTSQTGRWPAATLA